MDLKSSAPGPARALARRVLPLAVRHRLLMWKERLSTWPPAGAVRFGSLRRVTPVSRKFGFGRGQSIDRYYIENFLARQAGDIRGRVLEIGDAAYTRRFGDGRVTASDVLHVAPGNPEATIVGDLTRGEALPSEAFDCVVCIQTLQYIYEVQAAVRSLHRLLAPGGVALVSLPGIGQISRYDWERWGEHWRFTTMSARRLFGDVFGASNIQVEASGNVLSSVALLHGLSAGELRREELDRHDEEYQLSVLVRAVKA